MGQTHRDQGFCYGVCDRCGGDFQRPARGQPYRFCSLACSVVPLAQRIFRNVDTSGQCWLWTGKKNSEGYGQLQHLGRSMGAHRAVFEIFCQGSPVAPGLEVCHTCDNPTCVRPTHLFLGDHSANMRDMASKGRGVYPDARGMKHGAAKLSDDQVRSIRSDERAQGRIAAAYGISQSLVSQIRSRKVWRHVA